MHFLPITLVPFLPAPLAQTLAFVVGAGYLLWLGRSLLQLRQERARFSIEISLLGTAFIVAVGVAFLGLLPSVLPDKLFTALYTCAIGLAFLLVQTTLGLRPQLTAEVREAAQSAYVNTTLAKVDCDAMLAKLDALMVSEQLFTDADLSLATLATHLGLSPHQLSELLNVRLGKSFARYLREQRIGAAKAMLCEAPAASVLSVGLSVGYTSQSKLLRSVPGDRRNNAGPVPEATHEARQALKVAFLAD